MPKKSTENKKPMENVVVVALREFFAPLLKIIQKLPPVLAYSLAIAISIVVAIILRAYFPIEIVVLIGIIILAGLVAFVWLAKPPPPTLEATLHVVVHEENDKTSLVSGAVVTLALPDPRIKSTGANGATVFTSIPGKYIGEKFSINASEQSYEDRSPEDVEIEPDGTKYIGLKPRPVAPKLKNKAELEGKNDEKLKDRVSNLLFGQNNTEDE